MNEVAFKEANNLRADLFISLCNRKWQTSPHCKYTFIKFYKEIEEESYQSCYKTKKSIPTLLNLLNAYVALKVYINSSFHDSLANMCILFHLHTR